MLGYPAGECVVVEDAAAGIEAGRAAGARVIAFPTTQAVSDLRTAGANWVLRNCSAISVGRINADLHLELNEDLTP
jgi:beta-phosphoglucomutase-like phosphatase (HAD superfamily)